MQSNPSHDSRQASGGRTGTTENQRGSGVRGDMLIAIIAGALYIDLKKYNYSLLNF